MAEYKDIHGTTVRNSAGDLSGAKTGELFYDSTNRNFSYKFPNITSAGAWRTGGNMNTAKSDLAAAGIYTAALAFGGENSGGLTATNESYDGASWTEVGDLNTARYGLKGGGTQTSALAFGGANYPFTGVTESWAGSSWTEVADLNTARGNFAGAATNNTNALAYGGRPAPAETG